MRIGRPRTLLSLILVGLGLVVLPLLLAVGNAVFELNDLMEQSRLTVNASRDSTRANERVSQSLTNLRRQAGQYIALKEANPDEAADAYNRYRAQTESLSLSLAELARLEHPTTVDDQLDVVFTQLAALSALLTAPGTTIDDINENVDVMATAAATIRTSMRDDIDDRLSALESDTRATQTTLFWQTAALIPGTLVLVLFFVLLVGRPMRQIDRAIRELGRGDVGHPITVSGPADLETLGRQLEWLRIRLAESSAEKNKFLRHMSHELKTPLANIREGTELLLDGAVGTLDRQQQEVTGILRENSVKLQRLIENLLTFSAWQAKTASLDITQFELKPLVFGTLSQHRLVIANRGIKLDLDIAPIGVRADEGKLRLVLENLLSNAIKFTPEQGTIAIKAGMDGSDLVIDVADSGPGIAPEDRGRIFEAFYQGRRLQDGPVGGTGIGLSVVHECVLAHGGTIDLVADSGSRFDGAHFVVRLPLRRADDRLRLAVANG
ncbi:MAG TPA: HAMP domain-containing sensor histidine kinase [Gammaproteobacteria bacterium]|nr:HAMP domain-containing sensor histidine kinase [Gammaproteobacteria bacterium]